MGFLFNEIIYRPIYNLLIFVYNVVPFQDFGIAIIVVTLIIKFILIPLSRKQIESQKKMQEMQPEIKALQEKYKGDKAKQSRALMEYYKEHKTNPFSGCLPTIFQLIFLIAIYRVLYNISSTGLMADDRELYSFVTNPGQINHYFLGIVDLANKLDLRNWSFGTAVQMLVVLGAAAAQYFQMKMIAPKTVPAKGSEPDISQMMTKQMTYLGPLLTLFIGVKFPIGLSLYWLVSTLFSIYQQAGLAKKEIKTAEKSSN